MEMTFPSTVATTVIDSPVGPLLARASGGRLIRLSFRRRHQGAIADDSDALLDDVRRQLAEYFDGRRTAFDIPIELQGPEFQRRVWSALREIPYGTTISYGDLAKAVGDPSAARAVGAAN